MKYLWENNCDLVEAVFPLVAQKGHLEIYKYFQELGIICTEKKDNYIPFALGGNFREIVEILHDDFPPLPYLFDDIKAFQKKFHEDPEFFPEEFFSQCLLVGRKDILKEVPEVTLDSDLHRIAAILREDKEVLLEGLSDSVGWNVRSNVPEEDVPDNHVVLFSFFFGKGKLATWLLEVGYLWDPEVANAAASVGCLACIRVLCLQFSIQNFSLPMLQILLLINLSFLHLRACPTSRSLPPSFLLPVYPCTILVVFSHLSSMQWNTISPLLQKRSLRSVFLHHLATFHGIPQKGSKL
jgi:hypothetical protein